jgi:hypothetical protein
MTVLMALIALGSSEVMNETTGVEYQCVRIHADTQSHDFFRNNDLIHSLSTLRLLTLLPILSAAIVGRRLGTT